MKRTPLKRKTPFRPKDPEKLKKQINAWRARSKRLKFSSKKRKKENHDYSSERPDFIRNHPVCPVTGGRTTQIHHSAKREGGWLNLQRYWIAVSAEGHEWIEKNKEEAEKHGLMVRIRETFEAHAIQLYEDNFSLTRPVFYDKWDCIPIQQRC